MRAMFRSAYHRRPVVNGYSGYSAPHYDVLHFALEAIDGAAIDEISATSSILAVVDTAEYQGQQWARELSARPGVEVVGREDARVMFSVPASGTRHPALAGRPLVIQSASASAFSREAWRMIDRDLDTRWFTDGPQTGAESVTLDLGSVQTVQSLVLSLGAFSIDYPRLLAVELSEDGQTWQERWKGPTAGLALSALLHNADGAPIVVSWPTAVARFIRLRELAADPRFYWSVAEVAVFGP